MGRRHGLRARWHGLRERTRPVHPETERALAERWAALPDHVRTPAQSLGRHAVGCEGTHGVFPKCNLTCTPCYHSADANKVRIDGGHTLHEVGRQMAYLRERRGPYAHAQLIGGEVTLLSPDDHAAALQAMRDAGRSPMSMTHGDFEPEYLRALVTGPDGKPRFDRVSFAAHFDSLMRGRRGAVRPRTEAELNPFRERFVQMFRDLRAETGLRYYLAHNMTVTPANLSQVAATVRAVVGMGYSMMSFQPAAHVGDERRWKESYTAVDADAVWAELEQGMGQRIAHEGVEFGDPRCNRVAFGLLLDGRWHPVVDPDVAAETAARDAFFAHYGGIAFSNTPPAVLVVKVLRAARHHPGDLRTALRWARSLLRRTGGLRAVVRGARAGRLGLMTFEVHSFMDAADVGPAWELLQQGIEAEDPQLRATQERLAACTYSMAHPETGQLVPACAQHSVLDPAENAGLRKLLPLTVV
ncbi:Radical SAM superfamily enzyme, MoaA/NifB/PqqE/SkfB family [Blastococcus sp. DSM 46786]|uniref:radical SAM domain-containing protein n=1 Tax=Blastococcus sp. DSM 46786 TaxID=1798227 RepID=UPI0008B98625|nr:radical SAM domain-containing protein [Blastococcus sp. DSM 46786]SEL73485.1 Radical SAM superfamily enzyme, MoaA/NifB/PqqE/SkfB family [Blastococcus sp. DSM 46786]